MKERRAKRFFTDEFKKEAVSLVVAQGMSVNKVSRDLDLTPSALRKWVEKQRKITIPSNADEVDYKKLCRDQQKQIRLLTMERDILKKAATFFAKESE